MFTKEQVRRLYIQAMITGSLTLPFQDELLAKKARLAIYREKQAIEREDPTFGLKIQDYELVVRNGDLICRLKGEEGEAVLAAAGIFPTSKYSRHET